jgi:hypothetical protein
MAAASNPNYRRPVPRRQRLRGQGELKGVAVEMTVRVNEKGHCYLTGDDEEGHWNLPFNDDLEMVSVLVDIIRDARKDATRH